jgi:hypothetical protein
MKNSLMQKLKRNAKAVDNIVANSIQNTLRDQFSAIGNGNTKHTKQWCDYGYPESVDFDDLYKMWQRFGIAKAGIELPVNYGWQDNPEIKEGTETDAASDETEWEKLTARFFKQQKLFKKLKGADWRNRIGDYSAFIVQIKSDIPEETDWAQPLSSVTMDKVLRFIPVNQGQLIPNDKGEPTDDRYPLPNNYSFIEYNEGSDVSTQNRDGRVIHHTRVIIFAEGSDDNTLNGIPVNRAGYNALLDIEKVSGSGAEGFWKSVAQKLVLSSPSGRLPQPAEQDQITASINNAMNSFDASMMLGGLTADPLNATLPSNYKDPFMNALNIYAASVSIPATVLIGAQTGRLASDEDGKHLARMVNSRRNSWQTEMIEDVIDWLDNHLTDYNVPGDYCVEWSDLLESSFSEKVDILDKLANATQKINAARMAGETIVTETEFREVIGFSAEKAEEQLDVFGEDDAELLDD